MPPPGSASSIPCMLLYALEKSYDTGGTRNDMVPSRWAIARPTASGEI